MSLWCMMGGDAGRTLVRSRDASASPTGRKIKIIQTTQITLKSGIYYVKQSFTNCLIFFYYVVLK